MRRDIVVGGGGPSGAAAACLLARAGRPVTVLEREWGPRDVVCGDFISVEGQAMLAGLGVDIAALGAVQITHLRLVSGHHQARIALPFVGWSLTRRVLDEAILRQAEREGAEVRRGTTIRSIGATAGRIAIGMTESEVTAGTFLLATGKHDLRGAARCVPAGPGRLVGFKTYLALTPQQASELAGSVEVVLFSGGYAGLQAVEGGRANLCLLVDAARFAQAGRTWTGLRDHLSATVPHLAMRLCRARELRDRPLSIARVPYGFIHRPTSADPDGLWRLGDQAGVIPSFCGDGVAIALRSAHLAAGNLLAGASASRYHRQIRASLFRPIRLASLLSGIAQAGVGRGLLIHAARRAPLLIRSLALLTRVSAA